MIRATPSSTRAFTLFPYTPLFRAPDVARRSRSRVVERRRLVREVQGARSDVSSAGEIVRRISKNGPQARVRSWSAGSGWYRSTGRGLEYGTMQMRFALYSFWVALALFLPSAVHAATYTVGPSGRDYTQLSTLVDSVNLEPGDMVLVDGGTTYNGDIIVRSGDRGAPGNP